MNHCVELSQSIDFCSQLFCLVDIAKVGCQHSFCTRNFVQSLLPTLFIARMKYNFMPLGD